MTTTTEINRDRFGRYLILHGNGAAKPYTRATTIAGTLDDQYNLTRWKLRCLAQGLAQRPDIYARVAAADPDEKKALNELCADGLEAGSASSGANQGNALHEATARLDRGEKIVMPPPWDADLDAYTRTLTAGQITIVDGMIERVVVLHDLKVAGTFDRIVRLADGQIVIADLKTGQSLDWSWQAIAIQHAIYAHADAIYDPTTGFGHDLPEGLSQTVGLIIHLPAGRATCALHTVDLEAGWEATQLALDVSAWRKRKGLSSVYEAATHPHNDTRRSALKARVAELRNYDSALSTLASNWPPTIPTLKGDHCHTVAELGQLEQLVAAVETAAGVSF